MSLRGFELAVSLLRTLGQVVDVRWRWVVPAIPGNDRPLLLRLGRLAEGRLRPVPVPIGRRRRA